MKRLLIESLLVTTITLSGCSVVAAEETKPYCEGEQCFPSKITALNTELKKVSKARYRYYGFLVFDSALYATSPELLKSDFLGKEPCALRLCYHRTLTAEDFKKSGSETLALNPEASIPQLQSRIDLLHAKYREMNAGDCYQLSFEPGMGLELARNGTPEILIPGNDFARYYLGIWLSPYSFSESLTENLLTPHED